MRQSFKTNMLQIECHSGPELDLSLSEKQIYHAQLRLWQTKQVPVRSILKKLGGVLSFYILSFYLISLSLLNVS